MANEDSGRRRDAGEMDDTGAAMESDVEGHRAGHKPVDERARAGNEPAEDMKASDDEADVEGHLRGLDPKERPSFDPKEKPAI